MLQSKSSTDLHVKQRGFTQQHSILKNSQENATTDEQEILEARKQLILRRRRLFSHYRQYEQWRRRQFSYDPSYFHANPLPIGQVACSDYAGYGVTGGMSAANRRRRQYRRQYSCAERSREGSRESRASSSLHKYHSMVASDTINTESSIINCTNNNHSEPISFDSSDCAATAAHPMLHGNNRKVPMLLEERSTSVSERCTRSRINSAIFVSSEGKGFDSIEFLRRHGSQSVLCRKTKSAENITENGRKKSFAAKRQWHTNEEEAVIKNDESQDESHDIELKESRPTNELLTLPVISNTEPKSSPSLVANMLVRSAAITTSNIIVGSISLETPPAHIKDDDVQMAQYKTGKPSSQHSNDTVEELVQIPTSIETKSRVLVHQHSSTASSTPHSSPRNLNRKNMKPKICAVPMVSISGPSPPAEKPSLADCL